MRRLMVGLVCLAVMAVGMMPLTTARAQDSGYLRYNDGIVALDYPAEWYANAYGDFEQRGILMAPEAIQLDSGDGDLLESAELEEAVMGGTPVFVVMVTSLAEVNGSPREILDELFEGTNDLRTEKAGPLNLPNANGAETIGTGEINGTRLGFHAVALIGQGRFVFAVGIASEDGFEANRAAFYDMAHSLEFVGADHLPSPLPVAPSTEFSLMNGSGFSMLAPTGWQPAAIETFDGSLTVFCTPPAEPTRPYNSDLAAIDGFLANGTWDAALSAELLGCVIDRTVVGVITIPIALLDAGGSPSQAVLQRVLTSGVVNKIVQTRLVNVQNHAGAEVMAVVEGLEPVATAPYGLYSLVLEHEGWLVIFAASSPLEDFGANEAIFRTMAYSLTPQNLPNYDDYTGASGEIISYGTEIDPVLSPDSSDEWRFYGMAGDYIEVSVTSTEFDAVLELYDADGNFLVDNDDFNDTNPYITYVLPADGYYVIRVSAYSMGAGGNYHLSLQVAEVIIN